jgi:hypothetical protein
MMPTSQELHSLLAELQEKHPLKDGSRITLLFGGWAFGSADLKDKSIVLPRTALNDSWGYYAVIHEYAHFLSEDRATKNQKILRRMHNFLAHDRVFKQTEDELTAEYGIRFKRIILYPLTVETPWGTSSLGDLESYRTVIGLAVTCNWVGFVVALLISHLDLNAISNNAFYFLIGLIIVSKLEEFATTIEQSLVRHRHRKANRSDT